MVNLDRRWARWGVIASVVFLPVIPGGRRLRAQEVTATAILERMTAMNRERQEALESYTADRVYRVAYKGIGGAHEAEMVVHAEYRAPGVKHFTVVAESGSKMLCEKVLRKLVEGEEEGSKRASQMQSVLSAENYTAEVVGQEDVGGVRTWVLEVAPRVATKFTYRGRVWVSMEDAAVVRVLAEPAKNPSFWIGKARFDSQYQRIGGFWLPKANTSVSHVRLGGEARLTIDYGTYTISGANSARPETGQTVLAQREVLSAASMR